MDEDDEVRAAAFAVQIPLVDSRDPDGRSARNLRHVRMSVASVPRGFSQP